MTKALEKPSTLFVMQIIVAIIGTLAMAIGSLTLSQVEGEIKYVNDSYKEHKLVINDRTEKMLNKINENQIIIHEMLTEMKWSKAQFKDLAERVKDMEPK